MSDLNSPLDFYKSTKTTRSGGLHRIMKQMAFLRYLGLPFKEIHKYAAEQGYKGTYSSFTSWLRRNVDFVAEIRKHESEFRALDPRPPLSGTENLKDLGDFPKTSGETAASENEMFAPRTQREKTQPSTERRKTKPSVSEPSTETEQQPSPRDVLKKWRTPSYEDQLDKHGIGKHDDENSSS